MSSEQQEITRRKKRFEFKEVLPFLVFIFLISILLLSSRLTSLPPEIHDVSPRLGSSGGELTITGKHFGSERNGGRIEVAGISPPVSAYGTWNDSRISLIVPEEIDGGLVKVVTKHGESREIVPFTNNTHLPVVMSGPLNPGEPHIVSVDPSNGPVGTLVTITGLNFGLKRGHSRTTFAWISGGRSTGIEESDAANITPARTGNFDYVSWADREIRVRVPDGASSGNLKIETDKGQSNAHYFEVKDAAGTKLFSDKRIFHVQYAVDIQNIGSADGNGLYLWIPRVVESPVQRDVTLISVEPAPHFIDYNGFMLFFLENLESLNNYRVQLDFIFSRYAMETKIHSVRATQVYDKATRLYQTFTLPDSIVPSDEKKIDTLGKAIVKQERNPYRRAWLIYSYVLNRLSFDPESGDVLSSIDSRKGDSHVYSVLFCALARNLGIPARPVAGYVVDGDNNCVKHIWAEYYLENVGWVPVDPLLGDGHKMAGFPTEIQVKDYYFGNLDNRHIALTKGLVSLKQMSPAGRLVKREDTASFQSIHEEYVGNLWSYSSRWNDLVLLGIY